MRCAHQTCMRISVTESCRIMPISAVMQNWHCLLQPTWLETQSVVRSVVGIRTVSILAWSSNFRTAFKVPSSASSMCSSGGGSNTQHSLNTRSVRLPSSEDSRGSSPRRSARMMAAARPGPPICSTRDSNPSSSNAALLGLLMSSRPISRQ